jgi:hypothetical protein
MAKYVYCGATTERASELAALTAHNYLDTPLLASTLHKYFFQNRSELMKSAESVFDSPLFTEEENNQTQESFKKIITHKFPISKTYIGKRR